MNLPAPEAYRSAVQHPDVAFSDNPDLRGTAPATDRRGMPLVYSGNFTTTFHLVGEHSGWAVRCYTREIAHVNARYDAITRFLETLPDDSFTIARLVPGGINVHGKRHNIIQMEWIEGAHLNDAVEKLVSGGDREGLTALAEAVLDLGLRLESLGMAHGDIQHGNVLVNALGKLYLVDYDDMFLPSLAHLGFCCGIGQENYQHPKRNSKHYDQKLDRFAFISIYVTLRALAEKPELWSDYNGGEDCLLFRKADFVEPYASQIFRELDSVSNVKELVDRFSWICAGPYDEIPSLTDFIAGTFTYGRFVPKVSASSAATRVASYARDAVPVPVARLPISSMPLSSMPPQNGPRSGWNLDRRQAILAVAAAVAVAVILGVVFITAQRKHDAKVAGSERFVAPKTHLMPPSTSGPHQRVTPSISASPAAKSPAPKPSVASRKSTPVPAPTAAPIVAPVSHSKAATPVVPFVAPASPRDTCVQPDHPVQIVTQAVPNISEEKRTQSAGKSVVVEVDVAADGHVTDAAVINSAGDVALDFAALSAARRSTYLPLERKCSGAPGTVDVTVTF